MVLLYVAGVVNLMNYHIEPTARSQSIDFKLSTPYRVSGHVSAIVVNRLFIFIQKQFIFILIRLNMRNSIRSIQGMEALITIKLISYRSKQAVPISFNVHNLQHQWRQLHLELLQILLIQFRINLTLQPFLLSLCHPLLPLVTLLLLMSLLRLFSFSVLL